MPPANNGSTENVQPPVVQIQSRNPVLEPNVAPVVAPVPNTKPTVSHHILLRGWMNAYALADLGASINLMPFSVWEKLSLPALTPTLHDTSNFCGYDQFPNNGNCKKTSPIQLLFHFLQPYFVVVENMSHDPRVPLISDGLLKNRRALIDVTRVN
ncbi:hypothetical protein Tco_1166671 [Tanacetum coccineum]